MKKYSKPSIRSKKISAKMSSRNRPIYGAIEDLLISDVYANTVFIPLISSDKRLKRQIHPVSSVLDEITQLRTVRYQWKDKFTDAKGEYLGVIAQEVAQVYPELVRKVPGSPYLGVNYSGLTAVLLQAVKELKGKNDSLASQLSKLKRSVSAGKK